MKKIEINKRVYLGDGLYVSIDAMPFQVVLVISNGIQDTNTVYMDRETLAAFENFITQAKAQWGI